MPRTGRPSKPLEQKRRTGRTPTTDSGGRKLPQQGTLAIVATTEPELVDLDAYSVMDRILAEGVAWLGMTDTVALVMLREALEERTEVRARALAGSSEARKELRELDKQVISQLSLLGFDPAARSRLGLAEVQTRSKLEELKHGRKG